MAEIIAYCLKTKTKNVPMKEATIIKTSRGGFMAKGVDEHGNKMNAMLSKVTALDAIASGHATKGFED